MKRLIKGVKYEKRLWKKMFTLMKESIATWDYYTDFNKVYKNVEKIKLE